MNHNLLSAMRSHNEYELIHAQKRLRRVIPYNKRHNPVSYHVDDIAIGMILDEMPTKWEKAVAVKTLGNGNCLCNAILYSIIGDNSLSSQLRSLV